jgi:predicted nucleotidyltransferase component of viral defense system
LKLHENDQEFKEAVQAAAQHFKIREVFVEKDYWVTYVLKNLHDSNFSNKVVFKGGTSIF